MNPEDPHEFLTVSQVVGRLSAAGISRTNQTVRDWLKSGKLAGHPDHEQGIFLADAADLERLIRELHEKSADVARLGDVTNALTETEESAVARLITALMQQSAEFRPLIEQISNEIRAQRTEVTGGIGSLRDELRSLLAIQGTLLEIVREMQARQIQVAATTQRASERLEHAEEMERAYQAENLQLQRELLEEQRLNREFMERWEKRIEEERPRSWWKRIFGG